MKDTYKIKHHGNRAFLEWTHLPFLKWLTWAAAHNILHTLCCGTFPISYCIYILPCVTIFVHHISLWSIILLLDMFILISSSRLYSSGGLGLRVTLVLYPLQGIPPYQSWSRHSTSTSWWSAQWKQSNLLVSAHCPLKLSLLLSSHPCPFSLLSLCWRSQLFWTLVSSSISQADTAYIVLRVDTGVC